MGNKQNSQQGNEVRRIADCIVEAASTLTRGFSPCDVVEAHALAADILASKQGRTIFRSSSWPRGQLSREHLAANAMNAIVAGGDYGEPKDIRKQSYEIADAMLAADEEGESNECPKLILVSFNRHCDRMRMRFSNPSSVIDITYDDARDLGEEILTNLGTAVMAEINQAEAALAGAEKPTNAADRPAVIKGPPTKVRSTSHMHGDKLVRLYLYGQSDVVDLPYSDAWELLQHLLPAFRPTIESTNGDQQEAIAAEAVVVGED